MNVLRMKTTNACARAANSCKQNSTCPPLFLIAIVLLAVALFGTSAHAAVVRTWDGGGADAKWDTVNNWDNNALPATTASIVFATAFTSGTSIDLNGNRTIADLTISSTTDFSLNNNILTISGGDITRSAVSGTTTINSDIALGAAANWNISGNLVANGIVSGAFAITKNGTGTLILGGVSANTYSGLTTVNDGRLELNKTAVNAFAGSLTIGDGTGAANSAEVRITQASQQMSTATAVSIVSDGLFALNGNNQTIGTLSMTAGSVTTVAGTLPLGGNVTGVGAAPSATISGNLDLGGVTRTFTIADGGALEDMVISAILSSTAGGLTKLGPGTLSLTGANTYSGVTSVSAGALRVSNSTALGATGVGNDTTVLSGAALELAGGISFADETLTLTGSGISSGGALRNVSGNNTWTGAITLSGATRINSDSGTLTLDVGSGNAITGTAANLTFGGAGNVTVNDPIATTSGTLTKDSAGTLTLAGDNTYTGLTTISAGVVNIQHANALGTTPNGTTVSSGATLQIQGGITTGAEPLSLDGTGVGGNGALRNISGDNLYAGLITVAGTTRINSDSGTLTISAGIDESGSTTKTLSIGGAGNVTVTGNITSTPGGNDLALVKDGLGTLTLSGTGNNYDSGTTLSLGHLALGADNVVPDTGDFTFAGGILDANSHNDTIGQLTLSASSTLNLGGDTGTHGTLTFADIVAAGGTVLTINGWTGFANTTGTDDHIFSTAGVTVAELSQIHFTGYVDGAIRLGTGEIVPVPEPINVALGVFGAVFVVFGIGRRLRAQARQQA